jgi:hypothetical protein
MDNGQSYMANTNENWGLDALSSTAKSTSNVQKVLQQLSASEREYQEGQHPYVYEDGIRYDYDDAPDV